MDNKYYYNRKVREFKIGDRLLKALADESSSPKELIKAVLGIKGMSAADLAKVMGKTDTNVLVALNMNTGIGSSFLYEIAVALRLNPTIVFKNWADWILKKEQDRHNPKDNN